MPVSGDRFTGRLVGIEPDGNFTFETEGKKRALAPAELVSFGAFSDGDKGPLIILADGGTLVAAAIDRLTTAHLHVATDLWGDLRLPLGAVRGIVFRPPALALQRDKLIERVFTAKGDEDQLLLDNADLVSGLLKSPPAVQGPELPGVEGEGLKTLRLETKAGPVSVPVEKLLALAFNPALVEAPRNAAPPTWLGLKGGSRLSLSRITVADGKTRLQLSGGQVLSCDADELLEELTYLQPLSANVVYLSDLKPTGYKHIPFLELAWNFGLDKNVLGGRLRSADALYAKGISLHSTSRLAYRLDSRYSRFAADLALDDAAGTRGSVIYRVFIERTAGEWQTAYESPLVRGGDPPLAISLDVSGAERMALIVDFADRGDELDHANWLSARLVK